MSFERGGAGHPDRNGGDEANGPVLDTDATLSIAGDAYVRPDDVGTIGGAQSCEDRVWSFLSQLEAAEQMDDGLGSNLLWYVIAIIAFFVGSLMSGAVTGAGGGGVSTPVGMVGPATEVGMAAGLLLSTRVRRTGICNPVSGTQPPGSSRANRSATEVSE